MDFKLELEFYPNLNREIINKAISIIEKNKNNWSAPFFMDVYNYANIDKFKQVCDPYINNLNLKNIIILGTGGSIQTTLALSCIFNKKLFFIMSSRPEELDYVLKNCKPQESIVLPISRGGNTLDVNSTLDLFKDYPMIGLVSQGPMLDYLKKRYVPIIDVPDLSGRFAASICSVGLVPALLGGINIQDFLNYLNESYKIFKNYNSKENISIEYATFLFLLYNNGFVNILNMPYSSTLEGLVGLFVQELSESSGKEGKGLLGTAQSAPLCQHSVLELLLGGKKGHTSPFLWCLEKDFTKISINSPFFGLNNLTANEIINYQADATFEALIRQGVPSAKLLIKSIDLESLAQSIGFIQSTIYYFCLLLNVNWEDNPLVAIGKQICNEALKYKKNKIERFNDRKNIQKGKFNFINFIF